MQIDPVFALVIRIGFLLLFGSALLHKLLGWSGFETTVSRYLAGMGLGTAIVRPTAAVIVVVEGAVVALCALSPSGALTATMTAGVLIAYAVAMYVSIAQGNVLLDCGCSWGARRPVSRSLVVRNVALALAALSLAWPVDPRPLEFVSVLSVMAAVVICALLYAAIDHLLANSAPKEMQ